MLEWNGNGFLSGQTRNMHQETKVVVLVFFLAWPVRTWESLVVNEVDVVSGLPQVPAEVDVV